MHGDPTQIVDDAMTLIRQQSAELATLRARVEELERERDEALEDARFAERIGAKREMDANARAEAAESRLSEATRLAVEALESIRDYPKPKEARRAADGYPAEFVYDEFAYRRIVDSYRDVARTAIDRLNAMKRESDG